MVDRITDGHKRQSVVVDRNSWTQNTVVVEKTTDGQKLRKERQS